MPDYSSAYTTDDHYDISVGQPPGTTRLEELKQAIEGREGTAVIGEPESAERRDYYRGVTRPVKKAEDRAEIARIIREVPRYSNPGKAKPITLPKPTKSKPITVPTPTVVDEAQGSAALDNPFFPAGFEDQEVLEASIIGPVARGLWQGAGWVWKNGLPLWLGWEASNLWRDFTSPPGQGYGAIGVSGEVSTGYDYGPIDAQSYEFSDTSGDVSSNDLPFSFIIRILTDVLAQFGVSFA